MPKRPKSEGKIRESEGNSRRVVSFPPHELVIRASIRDADPPPAPAPLAMPTRRPPEVLQRDDGAHEPRKQGETFSLRKGTRQAVCSLRSHPLGWELRLEAAGEILFTHVCRSQDEVLETSDRWQAAMREKGWRP